MNEGMNSNYNSTPNYNYERKNSGVKVLLMVLILLVLCLIGLTCYKMFIYDKKNDNKQNSKNTVENNNQSDINVNDEKTNDNQSENNLNNNDAQNNNSADVTVESIYTKYLNKLSEQIGSKYNNGDNGTYQILTSKRVGGYEDLDYSISISNDKVLKLDNNKIADNVLEYFVVNNGNGGAQSLYYIDTKGNIYSVDHENSLSEKSEIKSNKLSYKNIVSVLPGVHGNSRGPIFVDIEGNMYVGENEKQIVKSSILSYTKYLNKLSEQIGSKYNNGDNGTYQILTSKRVGGYEDLDYSISISNDKVLKLDNNKIADNVLEYFVVNNGNGGAQSLYYIDTKGNIYSVDHENSLSEKSEIKSNKLSYKNIVSVLPGVYGNSRGPIFVDIEGNMYVG